MAFNGITHNGAIKKFLSRQGNPEQVRDQLERFYAETRPEHGVRMGKRFVIIERLSFHVMRTEDIVWVHHQETNMKLYGVMPTGSVHHIILRTRDGEAHAVPVATRRAAKDLMDKLFPLLGNAAFGYSQELVKAWNGGMKESFATLRLVGQLQHGR